MTDKHLPNGWNQIKRHSKENLPQESMLRAYTYSPDCICIQIRTEKAFASAILSDAQARTFAQYIIDAIDGHNHDEQAA